MDHKRVVRIVCKLFPSARPWADDIAQELMIAHPEICDQIDGHLSADVINKMREITRSHRRRGWKVVPLDEGKLVAPAQGVSRLERIERDRKLAIFEHAVARLPKGRQAAIRELIKADWVIEDAIAAMMESGPRLGHEGARKRLYRAIQHLKKSVQESADESRRKAG